VRRAGEAPEGARELVFDITDEAGVAAALAEVGELDALVNNAGIAIAAPLEFLPPDELARQLDVNVIGQVRVLQAVLPALRRSRGRVVFVGSIGGRSALPFLGAYAASKFALEAITDSLRVELAPWGIHVAIVEPGTIATPMWTKRQRSVDEMPPQVSELYGERIARFRKLATERSAGRGVPPEEVAKAIEHALTADTPKTRYVVGRDARMRGTVQKLPDRVRDRVLTRFLFGRKAG
jgi:NAD(P)-dependent dehydrogenase (short-subunit alcohol dehydrogenase family)